jgi:hypothetical protein
MGIYNRRFGCEFEFSSDFEHVADVASSVIKSVYGSKQIYIKKGHYKSNNNKVWHLKTDATTSCELTTPASLYADIPKLTKVLNTLKDNISITRKDSTHIHIQAKDIPKTHIIAAWIQIEPIIKQCVPYYRKYNEYCRFLSRDHKSILATHFLGALEAAENHYAAISLYNYHTYGTVEFRLCEGTLDYKKVINLIKFYTLFVNYAQKIDPIGVLCGKAVENIYDMYSLLRIRTTAVSRVMSPT